MKKVLYQFMLIVLCSIIYTSAYTQSFYKESMEAGKVALDGSDYQSAILNFTAAVARSGNTEELAKANEMRNTAFNRYTLELEEQRNKASEEEEKAKQEATKARTAAEKATLAATQAKASVLALQSKQALEDNNNEEALILAFSAVDTLNAANIPLISEVTRALGDAVRENRTINHSFGAANIFQAVFTKDSEVVVADRNLKQLISLDAQNSISTVATHRTDIFAFDISEDGQQILSASQDGVVKLNDKKTVSFKESVYLVKLSPNAENILAAANNQSMVLVTNGQINQFDSLAARPLALGFAPNAQQAFVRMNDGSVQLLDIPNKALTNRIQHPDRAIHHAQYTLDGNFFVATDYDRVVVYTPQGQKKATITAEGRLKPAVISNNGQLIAVQNHQEATTFWNIDGTVASELNKYVENKKIKNVGFSATTDDILIAFSNEIAIINQQGKLIYTIKEIPSFNQLRYAPNGQYILTTSKDNIVQVWNLEGEEVLTLHQHTAPILDAQFSSTSTHVMTYGEDGEVNVCPLPSFVLAKR